MLAETSLPCRASLIDLRDHLRHASPVVFPRNLDMPDLDRNVRLPPDAQSFVDGIEHGVALIAHMGCVNSAEL